MSHKNYTYDTEHINSDTYEDNLLKFDRYSSGQEQVASKRELLLITLPIFAWAFVRSIQSIFTTPTLLNLGLENWIVPWIWLAGPVSGILTQPLIGTVSDNWRSRWGKRKPFIALGTISTVIFCECFAFSDYFGTLFGDTEDSTAIALILAITSFWILDFALSVFQPAIIALLADRASAQQQKAGNGFIASFASLGGVLSGLLAGKIPHVSFSIMMVLPFMGNELRAMVTLGSFLLIICSLLCIIFVKEPPTNNIVSQKISFWGSIKEVVFALPNLPRRMKRNFVVKLFGYFGYSTWTFYSSTWYGIYIAGGDPSAPNGSEAHDKYNNGVMLSATGSAVGSLVSFFYAPLLIIMINKIGVKPVYFFAQLSFALTFFATLFVSSFPVALIINVLMSINIISLFIIPWTISAVCVQNTPAKKGLYLATSTLAMYFAQLINSGTSSLILKLFNSFEWVFLFVGIITAIGAVLTLVLIRNDYDKPISMDDDPNDFAEKDEEAAKFLNGDYIN
eukprot:TRINITY_DN14421_c0_g1_i1.p1 TRINITY_DN14421_c0_g1~~TRINITY_DN14421_c0_g1_i1.p1  ORF type:complete len:508 (+),score=36.06 TRINITY_DN14421_c0_g1_i1:419-1942(+)